MNRVIDNRVPQSRDKLYRYMPTHHKGNGDIEHVTITGRVYLEGYGYKRLVYLAHKYKKALAKAIKMKARKLSKSLGLDIRTASAYTVALRCLNEKTFEMLLSPEA